MFESKLNIYTIQKSAEKKVFRQFTEKLGKIKGQNTNLNLSCICQWHKIFYIHVNVYVSRFLLILNILI